MEGWGKIGVQSASVLYPNSCYNESCYIEVQVYFYDSNLGLSFCTPPVEYIWQKITRQCYILNFKIWAKSFWRRRFWIFLLFLWFEPRTPWCRAILDPGAFIWTKLVKDHYAMQHNKFQASLSQVVLKKIFEYFSMYFYGLNLGSPCLGPSWTLWPSFEETW